VISTTRLARVCAWVFALSLVASVVRAHTPVVVSVDAPEDASRDALRARVVQELQVRGHTIVPLGEELVETDAGIGLSITVTDSEHARIDVVVAATDRRSHRVIETEDGGHVVSTIALAAAELVEAMLTEQHDAPGRQADPPSTSTADPPVRTPEPPGVRIDGHVGMLWPLRTPHPIAVVSAAVGLRPTSRLGISTEGTVPFHGLGVTSRLAAVRTMPFMVGVRTDVDVLPARSTVRLDVQTGITAIALRIDVDPAPGVTADPRTLWTTGAIVGLHLHGRVRGRLRLGGSVRALVPFEDITLWTGSEAVQRLGPVWLGAALSIGAQW
jgi:hypothetical protein